MNILTIKLNITIELCYMIQMEKKPIFQLTICNRKAADESSKYSEFFFTRIKDENQDINDIVLKLYELAQSTYSRSQLKDVNIFKSEFLKSGYFEEFPETSVLQGEIKQFLLLSDEPWYCKYTGKMITEGMD